MFSINHISINKKKVALLEIDGPLNNTTSQEFKKYIIKILERGTNYILLNGEKIHFVSSEGIGIILLIQKLISQKNGSIIFFNLPSEVKNLYTLLGFDKVFTIASNQSDAMVLLDKQIKINQSNYPENKENKMLTYTDELNNKESYSTEAKTQESFNKPKLSEKTSPSDKFKTFIIKCLKCGSLIRINEIGNHICPHCKQKFNVTGPEQAVFELNLTPH